MNLICIKVFAFCCLILLPQIKADFNFRVPTLGCPDYFAEALVEGINQLRAKEGGDELPPLTLDQGVLAFEASAWSSTNRYLGNRRPRERRFGQNYWYFNGGTNTGNFRLTVQGDFLGQEREKHLRPMVWKRSSSRRGGSGSWSWQPFTLAEWAATRRVGVGCLTDYNSFKGGQAQVFVSLFYDYTKGGGGDNEGEGGPKNHHKTTHRPTGTWRTTLPTKVPNDFYPDFIQPNLKTRIPPPPPTRKTRRPPPPPPPTRKTRRPPPPTPPPPPPPPTRKTRIPPPPTPPPPPPTRKTPSKSGQNCDQLLQFASQPMSFLVPSSSCPAFFSKSVFCLLNEGRKRERLPPLRMISKKLNAEAANWTATKRAYGELWTGERRFGQSSYTIVDPRGQSLIPLSPERLVDQKFRPKVWSGEKEAFVAMEDASWAKTGKMGVGCSGFKNATGSVLFVVFFFDNADFSHGYE